MCNLQWMAGCSPGGCTGWPMEVWFRYQPVPFQATAARGRGNTVDSASVARQGAVPAVPITGSAKPCKTKRKKRAVASCTHTLVR